MRVIVRCLRLDLPSIMVVGMLTVCVYTASAESILLENGGGIVPLDGLENFSLKIATLGIPRKGDLLDRISFHKHIAAHVTSPTEFAELDLSDRDILIIFVTRNQDNFWHDLQTHRHGARILVCFVDRPPRDLPNVDASTYLRNRRSDDLLLLVGQIFGAEPFNNRLSMSIGDYRRGHGLGTVGGLRLSHPTRREAYKFQALEDSLAHIVQEAIENQAFPGAQLLVVHKNQIILDKVFGHHTYRGERQVQYDDLYDLASVTKVTTAVPALMSLVDEGLLDLDATLCQYFSAFCKGDKRSITFRQALSHFGRLKPYIVYWQEAIKKNGKYRARSFKPAHSPSYPIRITDSLYLHKKYKRKIERAIRRSDLNPEPGYVYSGLTFLLYPDLIEEKLQIPIDSFLYQRFFWPLGAESLTYRPLDRFPVARIVPTERDSFFRNRLVHGTVHDEAAAMLDGVSCNAGLFSNARDLAKLCKMYLNEGSYGGERYLSSDVVKTFTACQYCPEGNRRGLGFDKPMLDHDPRYSYVATSASPDSYGHSGFTGTFFWIDPANETILILLSNRVFPTRNNRQLYALNVRPRLHESIYQHLEQLRR